MAKYKTSGLVSEIRGSMGNKTFSYWKGIAVVKKKMNGQKRVNSVDRTKVRRSFAFLAKTWRLMGFREQAAWEVYARQNRRIKRKSRAGLVWTVGNWYSGENAFISVNQLLMMSGFPPLFKPLFGKSQPPSPASDLPECSEWVGNIRFKIWLQKEYKDRCKVQIWIKKVTWPNGGPYIMRIVPISTSPIEIRIDKIRFKGRKIAYKRKTVEKQLSEIGYSKLYLQMRTVAENGKFSVPSAIYTIELNREPLSTRELFSNKRVTDFLNTLQE